MFDDDDDDDDTALFYSKGRFQLHKMRLLIVDFTCTSQ